MNSTPRNPSWLKAISESATQQQIPLPPFTIGGMGNAVCRGANGRFVTFRRRLVSANKAVEYGVDWVVWLEEEDRPRLIATFREPLAPNEQRVAAILTVLRGWLIDQWSVEEVEKVAGPGEHGLASLAM